MTCRISQEDRFLTPHLLDKGLCWSSKFCRNKGHMAYGLCSWWVFGCVVILSSLLRNSNWFDSHSDQWASVFIFQRIAGADLCQVGEEVEDGRGYLILVSFLWTRWCSGRMVGGLGLGCSWWWCRWGWKTACWCRNEQMKKIFLDFWIFLIYFRFSFPFHPSPYE